MEVWRRPGTVLWVLVSLFAVQVFKASAQLPENSLETVEIEDEKGDDYGAGKVRYPLDKLFAAGTLDLTGFRAIPFSGGVQFQIDFAARVPRPPEDRKVTNRSYLRDLQNNGLFLQNVDIYIDQDGRPGSGETLTLPGRNADIDPSTGWERAIVLTPQPSAAASIMDMIDSKVADKILFPIGPQLRGKSLIIDVSEEQLGPFDHRWGYVVVVTGASFEESFHLLDPSIRGFGKSIFARIVRPSRDEVHFGGGDHEGLNTNIIDIILPQGMDQKEMLTPNYEKGTWAVLEAVFPNGRPPLRGAFLGSDVAPSSEAPKPGDVRAAAGESMSPVPIATSQPAPGNATPLNSGPGTNGEVANTTPASVPSGIAMQPAGSAVEPAISNRPTPSSEALASPSQTASGGAGSPVPKESAVSTPAAPPVPSPTSPPAPAESRGPLASLSGSVVDFDTSIVVIDLGKSRGLQPGRIGRVLDENGQTLVRFVVTELLTDFSVCKIIEGDSSKLKQGLKVELKSGGEG